MNPDPPPSNATPPVPPGSIPVWTTIDLTKRGDVALVRRAVVSGWDVPDAVREAICQQLGVAIENARGDTRRTLQLAKLMLRMEACNVIADGTPASTFPYLRKRRSERRRPRRDRATGKARG